MQSGSRGLLDADTPEDSAPRMVRMTDVEVNAGLLGLQQHMSQLVWLQIKTAHANPCRGQKVVQCGKSNVQEKYSNILENVTQRQQNHYQRQTRANPTPRITIF